MSGVFLIIYFVMHHTDTPFNLGYNLYKLLRTDSKLFFNTRLFWRKSHRDLFSVTKNTFFFFLQNTWINQHFVSRFLSNWHKVFAKCRVRTIPVDRTCLWWSEKKNCPSQWLKYIDFETKYETIFLQCQPLFHR